MRLWDIWLHPSPLLFHGILWFPLTLDENIKKIEPPSFLQYPSWLVYSRRSVEVKKIQTISQKKENIFFYIHVIFKETLVEAAKENKYQSKTILRLAKTMNYKIINRWTNPIKPQVYLCLNFFAVKLHHRYSIGH